MEGMHHGLAASSPQSAVSQRPRASVPLPCSPAPLLTCASYFATGMFDKDHSGFIEAAEMQAVRRGVGQCA